MEPDEAMPKMGTIVSKRHKQRKCVNSIKQEVLIKRFINAKVTSAYHRISDTLLSIIIDKFVHVFKKHPRFQKLFPV